MSPTCRKLKHVQLDGSYLIRDLLIAEDATERLQRGMFKAIPVSSSYAVRIGGPCTLKVPFCVCVCVQGRSQLL